MLNRKWLIILLSALLLICTSLAVYSRYSNLLPANAASSKDVIDTVLDDFKSKANIPEVTDLISGKRYSLISSDYIKTPDGNMDYITVSTNSKSGVPEGKYTALSSTIEYVSPKSGAVVRFTLIYLYKTSLFGLRFHEYIEVVEYKIYEHNSSNLSTSPHHSTDAVTI